MAPPSFFKEKKSPLLLYPARESQREAGDGEYVSCLAFPPSHSQCFSQVHFQFNCYFVAGVEGPPSVFKGNKCPQHHPLLANPREKLATVSSSAVFLFFFHPQCFLVVAFIIQLLFHCWHQRPFLCQKGNHYVSLS